MIIIAVLILIGSGFLIYSVPSIVYETSFSELIDIMNNKAIQKISNISRTLGINELDFINIARKEFIVCIGISFLILTLALMISIKLIKIFK